MAGASSATQWPAGIRRHDPEDRLGIVLPIHMHLISGLGWRPMSPGSQTMTGAFAGVFLLALQLGGQGYSSAPSGLCLCFPAPRVGAREKPPDITLSPASDTATPGGHWVPSQGNLGSPSWVEPWFQYPTGNLGCCLSSFPQRLKSTIFRQPRVLGTGGHWRQGDESWEDSMGHHTRTLGGLGRL